MMLQSHTWVKYPFKGQGKPKELNVKEYEKGIGMVLDSTLYLTFKNIPLVKFAYNIKEKCS